MAIGDARIAAPWTRKYIPDGIYLDNIISCIPISETDKALTIKSHTSGEEYTIYLMWNDLEKCWEGITCGCKSFKHRATCRHLSTASDYVNHHYPKVDNRERPKLIEDGKWYRCCVCGTSSFFIEIPNQNPVTKKILLGRTSVTCRNCGRKYEL